MTDYSAEEKEALIKSLHYWIEKWDSECPTLFGLKQEELIEITQNWPSCLTADKDHTLVTCLNSLGELLYGASAIPKAKVPEKLGVKYEIASALCSQIYSEYGDAL
jgi:hypothetical protein